MSPLNSPKDVPSASGTHALPPHPPTPGDECDTSRPNTLTKLLFFGLTHRARQSMPAYYSRQRPHFQPRTRSLGQTIHCACLNAASALCWPILKTYARLWASIARPSVKGDPSSLPKPKGDHRSARTRKALILPEDNASELPPAFHQTSSCPQHKQALESFHQKLNADLTQGW